MSVTQIRLTREQIDVLNRLSANTRLYPQRYLMRIDLLRLLIHELHHAGLPPDRITSLRALGDAIEHHFATALHSPDSPLAWLVSCLGMQSCRFIHARALTAASRQRDFERSKRGEDRNKSLTLRLLTSDLVMIDGFRCDLRERSGFIIDRSALIRVLIDSFVRAARAPRAVIRRALPHRSDSESMAVPR